MRWFVMHVEHLLMQKEKQKKSLQNVDTETGNMPKMLSNVMTIALCTKILSYLGNVTRMVDSWG